MCSTSYWLGIVEGNKVRSGPSTEVKTHLISELLAILLVELLLRASGC